MIDIIIPAYNEEKRIGRTLEAYGRFFSSLSNKSNSHYRILVVINNSTDGTERVVKSMQKKYKIISYLNLKQKGKGLAITEGFKHSLKHGSELIGFVDADLATEPEQFYRLINNIEGYDGAIADRYSSESIVIPAFTFRRLVVGKIFNILVRSLFLFPYRDTQCGAKVFRMKLVEKILPEITITQWAYDVDILYLAEKNGFNIYSCPTIWRDVGGGSIKIIRSTIEMVFAVAQLRIMHSPFSRMLVPLRRIIGLVYRAILKSR